MSTENKSSQDLIKELEEMYKRLQETLSGKKIFGQSLSPLLAPVEEIVLFIISVVKKIEFLEQEIADLKAASKGDEPDNA